MKTFNKFNFILVLLVSLLLANAAYAQSGCDIKGFVTFTQGGWGSPSNSTPGKIRDQYFSTVFPNGLVIGSTYKLTLTCASAVQDFIPAGGTSSFFAKNYTNVKKTSAGVFAGQMVALAMNIAYDRAGKIGTNSRNLEDLVFVSGAFAGKTVAEFFDIANKAIGGMSTGYSYSQLSDIATAINENFDNGTTDKGYLTCPPSPASLGDKVWNDTNKNGIQDNGEAGVSGVTVQLYNSSDALKATVTTDASGKYTFTNLAPGCYYVKFILPSGYVFSPKDAGSNDALDSDADQSTGRTILTTLVSGENDMTWDAGIYSQALDKASLGDKVWNDLNQNGIQDNGETGFAGVTVTLYNSQNAQIASAVTDNNGNYLFDNLNPGTYYVKFTLPAGGYLFSPKDQGSNDAVDSDADQTTGKSQTVTLTAGTSNLTVDAGIYLYVPAKSSIGDKVWNDLNQNGIQDSGEPGVQNVTVSLYNCSGTLISTTKTDANGNYIFSNLDAGDYYITVTLPDGYSFTSHYAGSNDQVDSNIDPSNGRTVCITLPAGKNESSIDAGIYIKKASLGDKVWNDANKNGIQDSGENGIPNVTVKLYNCSGSLVTSKVTGSDGTYLFDNLMPGDYYVEFTLPANYSFSPFNEGTDNSKDSDADPSSGRTACVSLTAGENNTTMDAGMYYVAPQENADLSLVKKVNNDNPKIGDNITYTVTLTNNGPASATGVVVEDLLPNGLDFVSASAVKGSYDKATGKWTVGSLSNNESADLTINVKVNPNSVSTGTIDLGAAAGFNLFVLGDLNQPSSDTQGKVAVGHDATLSNYSVADQLPNSDGKTDVLIVGNNLTYKSGAVYSGNVVYGNSTNLPQFNVSISNGTLRKDNPINFAAAELYLKSLQTELSKYAVNGTYKFEWGSVNLTGTDPFLNVFSVSGSDLSKANNMSIDVPNGAVVLINVDGQTIKWTGGLTVSGTDITNVLYNFYQATSMTIQAIDVRGSILAPLADVNFVSGVQNGQMIAKSVQGQAQFNNVRFIGNIPVYPDIINVAEVTSSDQHDPDSTPDNGEINEDDFSSVAIKINTSTGSGNGGVGQGSGNQNWQYVGSFSNGEIVWKMVTDNSGNILSGTWGGKIYKSTDKGQSWTRINPNMDAAYIWSIAVAANGTIFAGTEKGIYVSENNGTSWTLSGLTGKDVRAMVLKNGELYAGTWGYGMFKSIDNGKTWTAVNKGLDCQAVHSMTINSNNEVFAGTFGGGIFKSADHGATWQKMNMPYDFVWALETSADNSIIAGTYGDGIYKSTDGINFTKANTGLTSQYIYGITSNIDGKLYVSSWANGVYCSTDGGDNWNTLGMTGFNVSSITVVPNSRALFVGTSNGAIYRNMAAITAVNSNKIESVPETFELMQNYPNPFNPSTTIKFNVASQGRYLLKVYDILGKEVATLINEDLKPGRFSVRFDAASLSTGIYIYKITGPDVNMVKKMMLIK